MKRNPIYLDIETMGLEPFKDNITCICAESTHGKFAQTGPDEKLLMMEFVNWLRHHPPSQNYLVTQNGKQFDLTFILARLAVHSDIDKMTIDWLNQYPHIDLKELDPTGLSKKARRMGVEDKSGDGLQAIKLAQEGRWGELKYYCWQDVQVTKQVFGKVMEIMWPAMEV